MRASVLEAIGHSSYLWKGHGDAATAASRSGAVQKGQRSGLNLHRARHGFALEMRRAVSLEAASQGLGHSDLSTTGATTGTGPTTSSPPHSKRSRPLADGR
jgi:integrase